MIPAQLAAQVTAITAGLIGFLPPLLALVLLVARGIADESPVLEPHRWRLPRPGSRLTNTVVLFGFAVLAIRLAALAA